MYAPPQAPPAAPPLPPGWVAQWEPTYQRYFYVDTTTGQSHWVLPTPQPVGGYAPPPGPPPPTTDYGAGAAYPAASPVAAAYGQPQVAPATPISTYPTPPAYVAPASSTTTQPADPSKDSTGSGGKVNLASYYNLSSTPAVPQTIQPGQPSAQPMFTPANSANPHHSGVPGAAPVGTVDPTMAIPLELTQSVPNLMKAPPANCSEAVKNLWRTYLRSVQDAQNEHTRAIRDAQMDHDRRITDINHHHQNNNTSTISGILSHGKFNMKGLTNLASTQINRQKDYKADLDKAKFEYERRVEQSHQRLNDAVEYANRTYEDHLRAELDNS
ncbi:hypothetical protein HDV05_002617 [Chytridiales sp. JEL 0842]|nr:hypothetical protein HDV05_002617 [Chytridiales sp. JEL 0842]